MSKYNFNCLIILKNPKHKNRKKKQKNSYTERNATGRSEEVHFQRLIICIACMNWLENSSDSYSWINRAAQRKNSAGDFLSDFKNGFSKAIKTVIVFLSKIQFAPISFIGCQERNRGLKFILADRDQFIDRIPLG